jgi:hypothetical protein
VRRVGDVLAGMGNPAPRGAADPDAGGVMTRQGWFSWGDIHAAGGRFDTDANGNRVIRFPTWTKERGLHVREVPEHKLLEGER